VRRIKFRHRIGLLVTLAAVGLVAVTVVTLLLGRRAERQLHGIETQYVPLLELDRDLKRTATDAMRSIEDAAGAAEQAKLDEADRLEHDFLARLDSGKQAIIANGADPDALLHSFNTYYTNARAIADAMIHGQPIDRLAPQIDVMHRARDEFLARLDVSTRPDRTRLSAAFATARASQRESLWIDAAVAIGVLAIMALLSGRLIRRTVRSLQAVSDGVERLASGNFATPIEVPPGDEIGDLAHEANRTAERLRQYREEADRALLETQRQAQATEAANKELEAFSYSVSHDLRAPLRGIDGFSQALAEDEADRLSPKGLDQLRRVRAGAQRMGELIDDLLRLSRVTRTAFKNERVDLTALASSVIADLRKLHPDRQVEVVIQDGVVAYADSRFVRITLENLLGNAWKFTSKTAGARIELGARTEGDETVYFVRDNGAGFDMKYADRLFGAFQRLHGDKDFPGTGIGLATVQRVISRHGGRIWVEAAVGAGATFYFTLPGAAPAAS